LFRTGDFFEDTLEDAASDALRVISAKKRSTMLGQEAEVGVKCRWKREFALSRRF
jgi:hypothetical protein